MSWQTKIKTTGIKRLWAWQEETLGAWESARVVWAFFPVGGGRGVCSLLASMGSLQHPTLVLGPSADWLSRRVHLAAELNIPIHVWDGVSAMPSASLILLDVSGLHDVTKFSAITENGVRLVLDSFSPTNEPPMWWDAIRSMPYLSLPIHDSAQSWWSPMLRENPDIQLIRVPVESKALQWETWSGETPANIAAGSLVVGTLDAPCLADPSLACVVLGREGVKRQGMLYHQTNEYYGVEGDSEPPVAMPDPGRVILAGQPHSLRQLGVLGRRCSQFYLPSLTDSPGTSVASTSSQHWKEGLLRWFHEKAQHTKSSVLYTSSSELLQVLGQPVAPQPVFEEGIRALDLLMQEMMLAGELRRAERVYFQVHVHNVQKFQPVFLSNYPALLEFYEAYQSMLGQLSPLESLKLSFKARQLDLRELAARLPSYDVVTLNRLLQQLQENKLAVLALHTAPEHQRLDQEYQLELLLQKPASAAVVWWQQSGEHRTPLLWSALSVDRYPGEDTLEPLLSAIPQSVDFWQTAHTLFAEASVSDLQRWMGRVLRTWEQGQTPACLALWELLSLGLNIPGIGPERLLAVLPPLREMTAAAVSCFQPVFQRYQDAPHLPVSMYDYVLALPSSSGMEQWIESYLEQKSAWILQRQSAEPYHRELQHFTHLAQQVAVHDPEASRDTETQTGYPLQPWSYATAWAFHLLKQHQQAWSWVEKASPETPAQALLCAIIALGAKQPVSAQSWMEQAAQGHLFLVPELVKELHEQNFSICKAQARCKRCVLYGSSYCAQDLLELKQDHRVAEIAEEQREYMLAKRIRANVEEYTPEHWRQMLQHPLVQRSQRIQRSLLQHLAQAEQVTPEELRKLAQWAESYGDIQHAQGYRETLRSVEPSDALNLQKLADLYARQEKSLEALRTALEATHAHPRKYPLELWLAEHEQVLFGTPVELRRALLELPAHPALTKLEEKLSHLEAIVRELQPQLEQAERAVTEEQWGEAQHLAQQALERYPEHAPGRFQQILQEAKQREDQLWQNLRQLPKIPQDRNKMLEELAQTAEKHGLPKLIDASYRKLLQFNPQYGFGYLKWARITQNPQQRQEAYEKAVALSRTPQQMRHNLEEYIQALEQSNNLPHILPKLLELAEREGEEVLSPGYLEKLFLRLLQQYGTQANVTESIRDFLAHRDKNKAYQRLQRTMEEYDKMEPWKRTLLSLKNQES